MYSFHLVKNKIKNKKRKNGKNNLEHEKSELAAAPHSLLKRTVANFRKQPALENVHTAAQRKYTFFCKNRTSALYELFFSLVDEDGDGNWWEHEGLYTHSFVACVPFPVKKRTQSIWWNASQLQAASWARALRLQTKYY